MTPPMNVLLVRTSIAETDDGWKVRVSVENATEVSELWVGPFKNEKEANENGLKIAKMVRKAMKMEKQ